MNRIHRTLWNQHLGAYVAVAETTRSQGKTSGVSGALLASVLLGAGLSNTAWADPASAKTASAAPLALPSGGQVTAGLANIGRSGNTLTVNQGSARTAIEWTNFSIGKEATVQFVQPDAGAVALNRVTGSEGSVIDGALKANGQVFILNPNGVLFGKNAKVDTAGLVATTLKLSDADLLADKTTFGSGNATGVRGAGVVNQGSLNAKDGGYVVLMGNQVRNDGVISARLGTVALAAGNKVSLNFNGDSLVGVVVDVGALDALVANGNAIRADGGLVVLTAKGADSLVNTLVNNTGEIRAQTIENKAGRIYLLGEGGAVEVAGTLDASAPAGGAGGFIETSGPKVHIADGAAVSTRAAGGKSGQWLIDPVDFTIAASGGDITGTTLSNNLAAGSVTIQSTSGASGTSGDVNVNAAVSWSSNSTLTLNAVRNININAPITATGATAKLALEYGQGAIASGNTATYALAPSVKVSLAAGQNLQTKLGSDGTPVAWTVITALGVAGSSSGTDLQGISGALSGNFALGADIDASATASWNSGAGFAPIGTFSGRLEGFGHNISQLSINRPSGDQLGLFGILNLGAVVRDLQLTNVAVAGRYDVGGLIGLDSGNISDVTVSGTVTGNTGVGLLIGSKMDGSVARSAASGTVTGTGQWVGGLVGYNGYQAEVAGSSAAVTVSGATQVGGLVGYNDYGYVRGSSATGTVSASGSYVGGLVGVNNSGIVSTSYASGAVSGNAYVGGLVGQNYGGSIANSYAISAVSGSGGSVQKVGGLVGGNDGSSTVNNSYSAGTLAPGGGATNVGGLVGANAGTVSNSYWDSTVAGIGYANGIGVAQTTAQMTSTSTFTAAGWNFALGSGVWGRRDDLNNKYPVLRTFGYTDRIGVLAIDAGYLADPNAALNYTTSGLLSGDAMTLTQSGSTLSYAFSDPSRVGFYDAMLVRSQATTGNLTINRPIGWSNFKLTLESAGDINVNAVMSATGTSTIDARTGYNFNTAAPAFDASKKLLMNFNADRSFAGRIDIDRIGNGILSINNAGYTVINSLGAAGSTTSADLQGMAGTLAGRFALGGNIDASATSGWNSGAGFTPVGNSNTSFQGTFDGLGHTVAGLAISGSSDTGLFGGIGMGAALRNVALTGATVNAGHDAGILVGRYLNPQASNASIDNVHVSGTVSATGEDIGGLIGNAYGQGTVGGSVMQHLGTLTVTNASAAVDVTTTTSTGTGAGGLVGVAKKATISDSFAAGNATALSAASVGGLAGYLEDSVVSGSHATGSAAGLLLVGGLVGEWNAKSAGSRVNLIENSYATGNATSTSTTYSYTGGLVGDLYHTAGSLTITGSHATGNVMAATAAGGLLGGSEDGLVSVMDSYATGNVTSTQDAAGGLIGTTAGGTISGSQASGVVNGYWKSGGLVGSMVNTAVSTSSASGNVTGNRVSGNGASGIGGLVGWMVDSSVSTSQASGSVTGYELLGGLVGYAENTGASTTTALTNISATGNVTGSTSSTTGMVGGLVGQAVNSNPGYTVTISGAQASGVVYGSTAVGGLFGQMQDGDFAISGSNRVGNNAVTGTDNGVGGIVGFVKYVNSPSSLTLTGGNVTSPVIGLSYVGGAVGGAFTGLTLSQTASSGAISGSSYTGGLVGYMGGSSSMSHASSSSQVTAVGAYVGGLIGFAGGTVTASSASGDVVGSANVGGLIGRTDYGATISANHATGSVTATGSAGVVGGLVGYSYGAITESYATGDVSSTAANAQGVGGLVGLNRGTIENAYSRGNVSAAAAATGVGGLVGLDLGGINNAYSTGQVTAGAGSTDVGGLVGQENSTTTNSFWDVVTSGLGTAGSTAGSAGGTGKSTAEMNDTSLFTGVGWNFTFGTGVWGRKDSVNDKYPVLRTFGYSDPLTLVLADTSKIYGDAANPTLGGFSVAGCPTATCITSIAWNPAIGATTNAGSYSYAAGNVLNLTFAGGYSAGQFELNASTGLTIAPRPVTVTAVPSATRTYNTTDLAQGALLAIGNIVNGDSVALAYGGAVLQGRDIGTQTFTGAMRSAALTNTNYTLDGVVASGSLFITPKPIVAVWAITNRSKPYDGTTDAPAALLFPILYNGDSTNLSGHGVLSGVNVGVQTLVGIGTLTQDNPNYVLTGVTPTSRTITVTPRVATIATVPGATRAYDGSNTADTSLLQISNAVAGDNVALTGSGLLASPNAGNQTVALGSLALLNTNGNYMLGVAPLSGTVAVTARQLAVASYSTSAKVYDGNTDFAADRLRLSGMLGGDTVNLGGTATLAGSDVGRYAFGVGNLTLDNSNYTLAGTVTSGTVAVLPRLVSLSTVAGASQVYNGGTAVAPDLISLGDLVAGDSVHLGGSATLASRDVGSQRVRTGSLTLDNSNYTLDEASISGRVAVTARPVIVAGVGSRVYDGGTDAAASLLQIINVVAGDSVTLGGAATLASRNVGAEPFTADRLTLNNGNYTLVGLSATGTVTVTARPVSLAAAAGATKMYDGTRDASAALLQVGGILTGDTVQLDGNATLASRHVGAQALGTGSLTLSNGNYTLDGVTPSGTVAVSSRPVGVAAVDGASRIYDGSTVAAASLLQVTGVVAGDSARLSGTATLAGRDVGAQAFSLGGLTLDNADYTVRGAIPAGTIAITARPVTLATVDGASRVYDGSTTAAASLLQAGNIVAGDSVALGGTATLAGKAVGAQAVNATGLTLSNANYTLTGVTPTGTVAITPRTLNLAFTVADKVFDGSTAAAVTASDDRVAGDTLSVSASGSFADTTAGNAKAVAITGVSLTGADAGNYRVASTDAARGNLRARSVTYALAPQDPVKTYTASGQTLVSATDLDQLVIATFANTVAGTAPGALSYTLWRNGQQVDGIKEAGAYEVRASFAAADAHYALAETGNTVLALNVSPSQSNTLQETIGQAVRTEVPDNATAAGYVATTAPRPLAEFNPAAPNVAVAPPSITSAFGAGTPLSIVSSPSEKEPSEGVSLTQARRMVTAANGQSADSGTREVRVPVSRNSLAEIVNGGVKLPGGVDQLLFVVKAGQ